MLMRSLISPRPRSGVALHYVSGSIDPEQAAAHKGRRYVESLEAFMVLAEQETTPEHTVLLVDDNEQNLELLEVYMEDLPEVRVVTARNGLEAMAKVAEEAPELILLDIMMPKMSGFEVCKRIKSDPKTRDIIVVMVTALNETSDIERAAECGTDDYISKPVERKAVVGLVRNLLAAKARE